MRKKACNSDSPDFTVVLLAIIKHTIMLRKLTYLIAAILLTSLTVSAQEDLGQVMVRAEQMPYWNSCIKAQNKDACTRSELDQYIQKHLKYPRPAIQESIEGVVIISCIISKSGKVVNPNVINNIGGGCGAEALRVVTNMPLWHAAKSEGAAVSVVYNIKVPFNIRQAKKAIAKKVNIVYEEPVKPMLYLQDTLPNDEKQLLPSEFEETDMGKVYTRTSQMPYFPGCEKMRNKSKEKRKCSNDKLVEYLSAYLEYPEEAKNKAIEGIVFINFIVDEYGNILNPSINRDIGGGCGAEAIRVLSAMPKWQAGIEKGNAVKTKMSLPIRFFLSSGASGNYRIHWGALRGERITEEQVINSLTDDLVVRNTYGDDVTVSSLNVFYEKGSAFKEVNSNGDISLEIMRLLRKAKTGGKIIFTATIQQGGEFVDVYRVFNIVK